MVVVNIGLLTLLAGHGSRTTGQSFCCSKLKFCAYMHSCYICMHIHVLVIAVVCFHW